MPDQIGEVKITHINAGSEKSPVGGAGLDTEKSKAAAQKGQEPDKKKTNVFKAIGGILTGVLGIQVSFAAMLRQSQIATGFLGAVFQVLGAILDSFLLAFAPMLFRMVQDLARLIPIARAFGETIAAEIVGVVDVVKIMTERVMPALVTIGEWIMAGYKFISELNPLIKRLLIYAIVLPRIFNFFGGGLFYKVLYSAISKGMMWALAKSKAKEAGIGMAKAAGKMLMMIPHARIIMIALAVVAVVGTAIWAIFKPKKEKNESGALDISGQLGKSYLPSQASQLGGTLNEAYSSVIEPFTDSVVPQFNELGEALGREIVSRQDLADLRKKLGIEDTNNHLTTEEATNLHAEHMKAAGAIMLADAKQRKNQLVDVFGNTYTSIDAMTAAAAKANAEANEAIKTANDNWVTDLNKNTGAQTDSYGLLLNGTDAAAAALERQAKAIDEGNTNWKVGSEQSKNQWMSTASFMHEGVVEVNDKVLLMLAKGEMDKAMGSLSGTMLGLSDYIATIYETDSKALAEAAIEQKKAAVAFQVMSASVMTGHEVDRARREQERSAEAMNFAGAGDFGKFFDYLSNY